jgi:hypothetical protein
MEQRYVPEAGSRPVKNSSPFMEAIGSLPCSQEPTTELYPGRDESSAHSYIHFLLITMEKSITAVN